MPRDHWVGREKPEINQLMSLFENAEIGAFITGHLIVESVLVQLIELVMTDEDKFNPFDLGFRNKVALARGRDLIDEKLESFLVEMNRIRNRIAHRLGEKLTFDAIFELARRAAHAGIDFSDDDIYLNKEHSRACYGLIGVMQEVFQNCAIDLSFLIEKRGGKYQLG